MGKTTGAWEELLVDVTYDYGKRVSNKEKEGIYRYLYKKFHEELGYKVDYGSVGTGVLKAGYCIAGNLENAEIVFTCPLDTSRATRLPKYRLYPFNEKKRKKQDRLALLWDDILAVLSGLLIFGIGILLKADQKIMIVLTTFYLLLYYFTLSNRFTFSRSASLALLIYTATLKPKKKCAFVFIDKCADSYAGLRLFLRQKEKELREVKQVIHFDSLGSGEKLVAAHKEKTKMMVDPALFDEEFIYKEKDERMPLCYEKTDSLVFVSLVDFDKEEYVVRNVRSMKDRVIQVERLQRISEILAG